MAAFETLPLTETMPALFLGHGSPMNAVETNPFTESLTALASSMPRPAAIMVVSAHWLTRGVHVLCSRTPRTIHDFYGFPDDLYAIEYPAPGGLEFARAAGELLAAPCDAAWGLDHASWAVLRHMFPDADVPVFELSLDVTASTREHFELGRRLAPLRDRGVLVVGSGNLVHNLHLVRWEEHAEPYDWAVEFDRWARDRLLDGDDAALVDYESAGPIAELAVPTNDHYLPLLYATALRREGEPLSFTYEGIEMGSVSMRGVRIG
ncbi:MAG: 4,5-DOPA dioxygenase extradiol [Coriobacteriia bacterium]|nr:4,5-DOPA dioxygenase extradiol [Coriobacteriia bacterium]